jgi:hypothetical protein
MSEDNPQAMSAALDAIYDEAAKLLTLDLPDQVEQGLERIRALARYKFPVTGKGDEKPDSRS